MKNLSPLHHFLDILVKQRHDKLFLHQCWYAQDILEHAGMSDCNPYTTSVDTQAMISFDIVTPVDDPTFCCILVGALNCLTFTRLDISYAVQQMYYLTCMTSMNPISLLRADHL
jgi:hypothetical protein